MPTGKQATNAFGNIIQFYADQAEKINPVINQGLDDWFSVLTKMWREGMRLQNEWTQQWTRNPEAAAYNAQATAFGEKLLTVQKEWSNCLVNAGMNGVKSMVDAVKKK